MSLDDLRCQQDRRRNLRTLAVVCAVALALVGLARQEVDDMRIAGASETGAGEQAFVEFCHATPDNLDWCEWLIFMQEPANRAWFEWVTAPKVAARSWTIWDSLAECESHGEWGYGPHSTWGSHRFEGGLQFHPATWDAYRPAGYPHAAYLASREQQIVVGERVLAAQGWGAWPTCSRELGLR